MTRNANDVVRVYIGSPLPARTYEAALTEAGVACRLVGTELSGGFGSILPESTELWVHRSDWETAKLVIAREARQKGGSGHDRPHHHFPHPTDTPKPGPPPYRKEPYANPDPGG